MFATTEQNNILMETNSSFAVKLSVDLFSKRLWVKDYTYQDAGRMLDYINHAAMNNGLEKVILPVRKNHLPDFTSGGFSLEGWIDGYFNGADGYFLTAYPVKKRSESRVLREHRRQIRRITGRRHKKPAPLPAGAAMFAPEFKDIPALAGFFKKSFSSYPSPVDQPDYLAVLLGRSALFAAVKRKEQIISVAAAEFDCEGGSAELTNCATLPDNRGGGLMSRLIAGLEKECLSRGIKCLYSLARASSYGMNLVFHRLGYRYRGTLINNCHICGDYENMNIWAKYNR